MKLFKEIFELFPLSLLTFLISFETLDICIANEESESFSPKSFINQFYYEGRQHELPTITITSDNKIVTNGSNWKIWNFPNSYIPEEDLLRIEARATFPLYIFYEREIFGLEPYTLQKRYVDDYWNKSSYIFEVVCYVKASLLMFRNSSFEFRSNVDPFFGISVRYYFDTNENTVNIQTSSEIPIDFNDYFHRLTHQKKDENCKAHLLIQQDFNPATGVFKRKYDCYFSDGERGHPFLTNQAEINVFYIDSYNAEQGCIFWCNNDPQCDEKKLLVAPNDNQWSTNPACHRPHEGDLFEALYFPPVYVSLPQGKDKDTEIYFGLGAVNMDKMISMESFEEYQQNGSTMEIRCTVSEAVAGKSFQIALKRKNILELMFLPVSDVFSIISEDHSLSTVYNFKIENADIERIFCFAPVLGSYGWINASRPIHIIDNL